MAGIEDYLQDLGEQNVQEEGKIRIVETPALDLLCEQFKKCLNTGRFYEGYLNFLSSINYTAKDIRNLSLVLKKYETHKYFGMSGFLLSALINDCVEENFELVTRHLSKGFSYLGYRNRKNIIVIGDLEDHTGSHMQTG
ncbi:hypothetical protein HY837_06010, partial [archaeon]|nr:hypothetical protein [archaeon]